MFSAVLLSGVGSLAAVTYTWDPGNPTQTPATGSNGSGTWNSGIANFTNGTKDVAFPNKGAGVINFGTNTATNGNAGTVMVTDAESAATIRFYSTGSPQVNGVAAGYVFSGSGSVITTALGLNAAATLTTINVPLTVSLINFNAANSTLSLNANSTIGIDSGTNPSPNIQGSGIANGAEGTLLLNTGTYTIGTAIAIGTTSTATSPATGGVQVNAGAVLNPSTSTGGPLNDLGVGGYAANAASTKVTNGSGLLMINGGTVTTGSGSVYINNNTGTPAMGTTPASGPGTYALSGQLIVNSGVLNAGNQIVVGSTLDPAAGYTQSAELDINGGTVLLTNSSFTSTASILVNNSSTAGVGTVTAKLSIAGGVTTVGVNSGIVLNAGNSSVGTSTLSVSGGSLFLGNGGSGNAITNAGSATAIVNFSGGTLGAINAWATALPTTLTGGNTTFQTSNLGASDFTSQTPATTFITTSSSAFSTYPITLNGVLSGPGSLTTTGGGTLTLAAANTYTGTTSVLAGTLLVGSRGSLGTPGTPAGTVSVSSGATLTGTGVLTVTSASVAGTLAPGAGVGSTSGTLTLNTTGGLAITGTLLMGINGSGSTVLSTNGTLNITGATLTLSSALDGMSNYDVANYTGTLTGTFANFTVPTGYMINYDGTSYGAADIELDVASTPVPEPATWAGCLLGLGLLARSRCQRRSRRGIGGRLAA